MTTKTQCDRCKKLSCEFVYNTTIQTYTDLEYSLVPWKNKPLDICKECTKDLMKWLEYKEPIIGAPI